MSSYNWSHIDEEAMKKVDPDTYRRWRIIEMLTYGLGEEKLNRNEVKELWRDIKDELDTETRRAVEFLLWGKAYSLHPSVQFWNRS